jgi:hypothetical protein
MTPDPDRPKRKAKTIAELIEEIKAGLPSLPAPPPDAEPPPKPPTECDREETP